MKADLPKLVDAICDAFSMALPDQKWAPTLLDTFCNEAVNFVCWQMGYDGFSKRLVLDRAEAIMANQMVDIMDNPNGVWMSIDGSIAQAHANKGALVLAGIKNPEGHGHVCIVRPGMIQHSNTWQREAPRVMNVGKNVFIDKKASFAFKEMPNYYVIKEMI